jgi:hypothetical protein
MPEPFKFLLALAPKYRERPTHRAPTGAAYFVTPRPFEPDLARAAASCRPRFPHRAACSLSLRAKVWRSCLRPLRSSSANSDVSIEEIVRVSGRGADHRRQARRIQRYRTRGFLI